MREELAGLRAHVLLFALFVMQIYHKLHQRWRSVHTQWCTGATEASEPEAEHRTPNEHKTRAREHMNHEA